MNRFSRLIVLLISVSLWHCFAQVKQKPIQGCSKISGMPGPEDFAADKEKKILYITSHDRRKKTETGKIYSVNIKDAESEKKPLLLEADYPKDFNPHGISILKTKDSTRLYVISHPDFPEQKGRHKVEIFSVEKQNRLKHIQTLQDDLLHSPNDLFVLEDGRILVSNDHGSGGKFRNFIDDLFRFKRAEVVLYDGQKWKTLEDTGASFGNGIIVLKKNDKTVLYRASTIKEKIDRFEITDWKNFDLKKMDPIKMESGPDNLETDEEGYLWTAAHISMFRFLFHASDAKNPSPSQVFKISPDGALTEIYADRGEEISASSTGLKIGKRLYIAQVFEDYLLSCPLE